MIDYPSLSALAIAPGRVISPSPSNAGPPLKGLRESVVALAGNGDFVYRNLLELDGQAKKIFLLPAELRGQDLTDLFCREGIETLLTDCHSDWSAPGNGLRGVIASECGMGEEGPANPSRPGTPSLWLIPSSGSTGCPKFIPHTSAALVSQIKKGSQMGRRWGLLYDPARFAGVQVLLQAMLNSETLLAPTQKWDLPKKIEWLGQQECNALSATPSLWRQILACPTSHQLPLRQITLGGEICDATILLALRTRFPMARITQIYASTEVGVVFSVHDGQPGFPASWLDAGAKDCKLRVAPDDTLEVARKSSTENDFWLNTGDIVEQVGERVYFRGRKSGLINIGGNKVYPEEVEATVSLVEGVESVLVCARASSMLGSLLEAQIVATDSAPSDLAERVRLHCQKVLPRFKQPAFIKVVAELPTNANGKRIRAESR